MCNKNAFQTLICKRWDVTKLQTPCKHVRCILLLTRKVFRHGGWGSVGEKPAAQNHRHFCLCWYYRTGFTANLGPVLSSRRRVGVEASHFYRLKEKDKAVLFATSAGTCSLDSAKSSHHLKSLLWQAKTINCTPKLFKGAILFYSWAVSGVLSSPVMFLGASSRTSQIYVTLSHELQHKAGDFFLASRCQSHWFHRVRTCSGATQKFSAGVSREGLDVCEMSQSHFRSCEELNTLLMSPFPVNPVWGQDPVRMQLSVTCDSNCNLSTALMCGTLLWLC